MRANKHNVWMNVALEIATLSTCIRRSVGCVLVDYRGHVLSTGVNGVASGLPHCNESTGFEFVYANGIDKSRPLTGQSTGRTLLYGNACTGACAQSGLDLDRCEAIHAEQNALLQCPDVHRIATCYCTAMPCITCTKLLLNTSCERIIYNEDYAAGGQALWQKAGRELTLLNDLNTPPQCVKE